MREARVWLEEHSRLDASLQWAESWHVQTQLEITSMAAKLSWSGSILSFSSWFLCLVAVGHLAEVTSALLTSLSKLVIPGHNPYREHFELCGWKALKYDTLSNHSGKSWRRKDIRQLKPPLTSSVRSGNCWPCLTVAHPVQCSEPRRLQWKIWGPCGMRAEEREEAVLILFPNTIQICRS